jgi:D-aminopeptidase
VPVGEAIGVEVVPSPYRYEEAATPDPTDRGAARTGLPPPGSGSIIIVVATDAPLLPHSCERLAQRAGLGIARAGATGGQTSGDLFIAFATGNRFAPGAGPSAPVVHELRGVADRVFDPLFMATIEATEEAVINALIAAETMTGRDGHVAEALPHAPLLETMARYGRGARRT